MYVYGRDRAARVADHLSRHFQLTEPGIEIARNIGGNAFAEIGHDALRLRVHEAAHAVAVLYPEDQGGTYHDGQENRREAHTPDFQLPQFAAEEFLIFIRFRNGEFFPAVFRLDAQSVDAYAVLARIFDPI